VSSEKARATSTESREALAAPLQFLYEDDALAVTRIERLAWPLRKLHDIVHDLRQRGVRLKATEQPIGTSARSEWAWFRMCCSWRSGSPS
jgi:DNA invertase Pin-like site-specific DNA recombinase